MRVSKKHDVRLNEILDAAELFFTQKGYEQATVNDILDKVEIGKGTFYHYFKSKEDVMAGVIRRIADGLTEKAKGIAADNTIGVQEKMKNRRASPAVSLTFKLYSDKETAQAASLHVFFDIPPVFVPDS